jgi:hypothetical protein
MALRPAGLTGHRRLPLLHAQPPMATAAHSRSVSFAFLSLFSLQATTVDAPHHGALLLLRQPKGSACTTQRSAQLLDTLALSPRSSVYFISLQGPVRCGFHGLFGGAHPGHSVPDRFGYSAIRVIRVSRNWNRSIPSLVSGNSVSGSGNSVRFRVFPNGTEKMKK